MDLGKLDLLRGSIVEKGFTVFYFWSRVLQDFDPENAGTLGSKFVRILGPVISSLKIKIV
jgi:hypothetical protein